MSLSSTGAPLGLLPPGLPYDETSETLHPGDALVLYSDGVTDAQNADDEEFGEAAPARDPASGGGQPTEAIIDRVFTAIEAFVAGTPQFDDMTMLVVRRTCLRRFRGRACRARTFRASLIPARHPVAP